MLKHGAASARVKAAAELGQVGSPAAVPALKEALRASQPLLRLTAGFALWRIQRDRDAVEVIVEVLANPSPDAREGAVYALGAMGKEIVPILEDLLAKSPERPELRRLLAEVRGQSPP
jgi:HEAT repeat protein